MTSGKLSWRYITRRPSPRNWSDQVNEHIKIPQIPFIDKVGHVSVAMQRHEPLDADLLKGPVMLG